MLPVRIIPRLDIKGPNLVKGVHLEGLRVLGKPYRFAKYYYENGADELLYMDVVASLYERNSLTDIVEETAKHIFIPLTVGGGIRTLEDIRLVLRSGADKVSINKAAIRQPAFIRDAANRFGSSTIVVSIEALRMENGEYEAYVDNGREPTGVNVLEWADRAVELGAGELLITSIDMEGTGKGFDVELVKRISSRVNVPIIACGGAGQNSHVFDVVDHGKANAVCISSLLHYRVLEYLENNDDFSTEGNTEYLKTRRPSSNFRETGTRDIKAFFNDRGICVRHEADE